MEYYTMLVSEQDLVKTALLTHRGLYVYNVMPFGICNAPATFQRLIEKVLGQLVGSGVLIYLDDVLLYADDPKDLIELLHKVLKRLFDAGLKCKAKKYHLFSEEIHYLIHVVRRGSFLPESAKIDKIQQWPRPDTGTELASFLGLCNYYRTLVPSFVHVSDAIYKASQIKVIKWNADLSAKFEELKALMLSAPVVRLPDVDG